HAIRFSGLYLARVDRIDYQGLSKRDKGTRGQGDKGTRGQGDFVSLSFPPPFSLSPCPLVPTSPHPARHHCLQFRRYPEGDFERGHDRSVCAVLSPGADRRLSIPALTRRARMAVKNRPDPRERPASGYADDYADGRRDGRQFGDTVSMVQ